jgi:aminopeptidase-like protein
MSVCFRLVHIHRLCEDFAFNIKHKQHSVSKFYLDYIVENPTVSEVLLTEYICYGKSTRAHIAVHYVEETVTY